MSSENTALNFLRTLANITYGISLSEALTVLDAALAINPVVFSWATATNDERVAQARTLPDVMQHIGSTYETSKKIQAIKELRSVSGLGLKESKDVIDVLCPTRIAPPYCYECGSEGSHYTWCSKY